MSGGIPGKKCAYPGCEQRPYGPRAIRCPKHFEEHERQRNAEGKKKRRERDRARGYCTICGVREATPGLRTCLPCRDHRKEENAVKNLKRVEGRREVGKEIVRKVHRELGQMLRTPEEVWDPHRVRALGHFLASYYLYQKDCKKLPSLTFVGGRRSAVHKLHREVAGRRR